MKVSVLLKGYLVKYFEGESKRVLCFDEELTIREAVKVIGIDPESKSLGFVAVNGMRVMIDEPLKEGDQLKIYPRISGG